MSVEIRRASQRFVERHPGRSTRHSLAFGSDYDPENLRFGPMVCHDDHLLALGGGFDTHAHSELEIVSWVLSGALAHRHGSALDGPADQATSPVTTVGPGSVAVLTAGRGVEHQEHAAAPQTRFVQVWLTPREPAAQPAYAVRPVSLTPGELSPAAEPVAGARFAVARLEANQAVTLPEADRVHTFVGRGALLRSSLAEPMGEGDAFRFVGEPARTVTAAVPTELLVWSFDCLDLRERVASGATPPRGLT